MVELLFMHVNEGEASAIKSHYTFTMSRKTNS